MDKDYQDFFKLTPQVDLYGKVQNIIDIATEQFLWLSNITTATQFRVGIASRQESDGSEAPLYAMVKWMQQLGMDHRNIPDDTSTVYGTYNAIKKRLDTNAIPLKSVITIGENDTP